MADTGLRKMAAVTLSSAQAHRAAGIEAMAEGQTIKPQKDWMKDQPKADQQGWARTKAERAAADALPD